MLILLYLISFTYHEIPGVFLNLIYKKFYGSNDSILLSAIFPFFINKVVILSRTKYTYLIFYQPTITREIKINTKKNFLIVQNQPVCHTVITTSVSTSILTNYVTLFQID